MKENSSFFACLIRFIFSWMLLASSSWSNSSLSSLAGNWFERPLCANTYSKNHSLYLSFYFKLFIEFLWTTDSIFGAIVPLFFGSFVSQTICHLCEIDSIFTTCPFDLFSSSSSDLTRKTDQLFSRFLSWNILRLATYETSVRLIEVIWFYSSEIKRSTSLESIGLSFASRPFDLNSMWKVNYSVARRKFRKWDI